MVDFEEVYGRYFKDVFQFSLSLCGSAHLAEDITSEAFLKAIKKGGTFDGRCSLKVWLCQIAKHTYYDYLRKHAKLTALPSELPSGSDFEVNVLDKAAALEVHKRLHRLDEPYKEVFSLRIFSELSFLEIGEIFSKSESWARVTFHRAKLKLKEASAHEFL